MPKRARRSLRLLPYLSCSVSASTIRPPPSRTNCPIASSSSSESRGESRLVVYSHLGSEGWAMTRTSASARTSVRGRSVLAVTVKSWAARARAASTVGTHANRVAVGGGGLGPRWRGRRPPPLLVEHGDPSAAKLAVVLRG